MIERDDPQDHELAALYREASREAPSSGLDARILAAARATAPAPRRATSSWVDRWKVPVALAATVVLTTTVTLLVLDEEAARLEAPQLKSAATETATKSAPAPASTPPAAAAKPAEALRKEARSPQPARDDAMPLRQKAPATAKAEAAAPDLSRSTGAVSSGEGKAAADAPAAEALRSAPAGNLLKDQPAPEATQPRMQTAPRASPAPAAAPAAKRADSAERVSARTPDQWIADIRRLKQESKTAEAEASLAEFRKFYPWYALPDDLKQP